MDSHYDHNQKILLTEFKRETYKAIERKVSLNPILNSFQICVNKYKINLKLIDAFLYSMEMDLYKKKYNQIDYDKYIYGSAESVGLMCLKVFCIKNNEYKSLKKYAKSLGSAFQKINFLRDIKSDFYDRERIYFPNIKFELLNEDKKKNIQKDIQKDFETALIGIKKLPIEAKLGVYLSYKYYLKLFRKITNCNVNDIKTKRIRISNFTKFLLLIKSYLLIKFNLIK